VNEFSVVVDEIADVVDRDVESHVNLLLDFINTKDNIILTYVGSYSSPATYMLLLLRSLSKVNAYFFKPKELTYYVVPYDEGRELSVVIYASHDGLSELSIVSDQLRLTGHEFLIITPTKLPSVITYRIPKDKIITLELEGKERYWLLLAHIINGKVVSRLTKSSGIRVNRVKNELNAIKPIITDLITYYEKDIDDIVNFMMEPLLITSTPTMRAVAEYLAYSHDISTRRFLVDINEVRNFIRFINRLLIIETDVEEYSIKEIRGLTFTTTLSIKELRLRTDPLTAPIYGLILARVIEYLASRRVRGY